MISNRRFFSVRLPKDAQNENSDVDLLVDSRLKGLRLVGFTEAVSQAVVRPVNVIDVSHIKKDSRIDKEIRLTGVTIYAG